MTNPYNTMSTSIEEIKKIYQVKTKKVNEIRKNKREPFLKAPSVSKEVALHCGIASRSNPTYLPFLSLITFCFLFVLQR